MSSVIFPAICWFLYQNYLRTELEIGPEPIVFHVPANTNLSLIADELYQMGVLEYPRLFVWHAQLNNQTLVQTGEYQLEQGLIPNTLLEMFNNGEVRIHSATFPEGTTFADMRARLEAEPYLTADTRGMDNQALLQQLGVQIDHPEGWFYPDTYVYPRGFPVSRILKQAHERMRNVLEDAWSSRDVGLPLESSYEMLILASIVEKETGVARERPEIAGVFIRRLQRNMRLQTDPTVIYALGEKYDGNIRRSDLSFDSPYNTYVYRGLPPTPIALPGEAAIRAVAQPAHGDSLYFVAKGDGSHYFSSTLEEHNEAVRRYQIERRSETYRSAPSNEP